MAHLDELGFPSLAERVGLPGMRACRIQGLKDGCLARAQIIILSDSCNNDAATATMEVCALVRIMMPGLCCG